MKLAIVDVGCGNIGSVGIAFERQGLQPVVTSDPAEMTSADKVVLPGVGWNLPGAQARHADDPEDGATDPAGQTLQEGLAGVLVNVPGEHGMQKGPPGDGWKNPGEQGLHRAPA